MIYVENAKFYKGPGFYIDRATPLGNLFPLDLGREESIELYRAWLTSKLGDPGCPAYRYFNFLFMECQLRMDIHLICHCKPLACHGDVIKEFILKRFQHE